ncbi:MAG: acetolactate synthase small subunit [Deltaproteobacteria bacterium HGW-Deltaproteobacteria-14]|jgi:acetolactate synthase-1/3 small subunit|nr:MAG: acetolactate synthase small subunit [Deltaproteobacteria bacterium HGW-Deltaproteobacteria-14]
MSADVHKRTFVVWVEDQPGVLNRVASLFRRRAYNIESLNVGQTHEPGVSRMTVVCHADSDTAKRIEANLYKLVNVLEVDDITHKASLIRDLALIKVRATSDNREQIVRLCEVFRARVVDVGPENLVIEITGAPGKIKGLVTVLEEYGIEEMVQSGAIALTRGVEPSMTRRNNSRPTLVA